jgi:hypothetical protein
MTPLFMRLDLSADKDQYQIFSLLEISNEPNACMKATKYAGKKKSYCRLNQTPHTGNPDRPSDQATQLGHLSHLNSIITAEVKNYNSIQCRISAKICYFYVGTIQRISLSSILVILWC